MTYLEHVLDTLDDLVARQHRVMPAEDLERARREIEGRLVRIEPPVGDLYNLTQQGSLRGQTAEKGFTAGPADKPGPES